VNMIECQFNFHPVGQGLFYSGRIGDFRFVYDCGTASGKQHLDYAIASYDSYNDPLDLLVISHFHNDHLNGISQLLKKTGGAKEVVIPYLSPFERLMVAAEYAVNNELDVLNNEYLEFLKNPWAYLTERGCDHVTFLLPGEDVKDRPYRDEGSGNQERYWSGRPLPKEQFDELEASPGNVHIREGSNNYRTDVWAFKFYCQLGLGSREAIENELREFVPAIDPDDIAGVLSDRLDDLKSVYFSIFGGSAGQNSTSVMCCHGPITPGGRADGSLSWNKEARLADPNYCGQEYMPGAIGRCFFRMYGYVFLEKAMPCGRCLLPALQMLTGDVKISLNEYQAHFRDELDLVGLFQLPHHGSNNCWHRRLPSVHPKCGLWVASFGLGNGYGHPSRRIVQDLAAASRWMVLCNEVQRAVVEAGIWRPKWCQTNCQSKQAQLCGLKHR